MQTYRPIIAIVSCHKMVDGQPAQAVYQKYIDAVNFYGGNPILLPNTAADSENFDALLAMVDGILLTGSYSNVAPTRYGATHVEAKQDLGRDELSFKLLAYADERNMPLLAVCRGLQEMNVYFNGSLHPDWREVEGFYERHLEDSTQPLEVQYQPVHDVIIQPEGRLAAFGEKWHVNSLHKQAINTVGRGLFVEARAL
ncbi:gamma-glutamyl-gamma-aminobutyrate hydrolase family protein, partial [Psychrobacter sp. 16-Bac2893]